MTLLGFWGLRLPPGETVVVDVDESRMEMIHVGKIALGPDTGDKAHCVKISDAEHGDIYLCRLDDDEPQTSVEFVITQRSIFSHTGDADVYLSGFKSYEDDSDDEDDDGPLANGLANGRNVKASQAADDDEDEDEDDESYDEDEDLEGGSDDDELMELDEDQLGEEGDEDEDDEDDDEESEEEAAPSLTAKKRPAELPAATPAAKKQATATLTPAPAKKQTVAVKEALGTTPGKVVVKTPKAVQNGTKGDAKTPKGDAKTPKGDQNGPKGEAKTPKGDTKTPKSDQKAPKTPATPATPGSVTEYVAALKSALKDGPLPLTSVGSAVKKPKEVQKLKAFLLQHADTFVVSDDKVSLK